MKRNNLCAEIGYLSVNHYGEQLCGDHVDVVENDNSTIIVLADGMGSGVKASILSTLTSKIISGMLAAGLDITDAVETIAATLPVCSERKVAFSTFTILRIVNNERADIIQYENPNVAVIRDGESMDYPITQMHIDDKIILYSSLKLQDGDIFVAMSDGLLYASDNGILNDKWDRDALIDFVAPLYDAGLTAKTLTSILLDETVKLYGGKPFDDATVCVVKIRQRQTVNIAVGPPRNRNDNHKMMSLFFAKEGKHIVCGGTTSTIAANYLRKPLKPTLEFVSSEIPPIAKIEGVDLVTEGVITVNKVLEYAKDYLLDNETYEQWSFKRDGASLICQLLFEEATDINFYVGKAVNPAHQNPDLPINFNIKMNLVKELSEALQKMGKRIKLNYF